MTDKIEPPEWIYPEAKVYVVTRVPGASEDIVSGASIRTVAKQSFTLHNGDGRFSLRTLTYVGETSFGRSYQIVDPNSEEGRELWSREIRRRIRIRARNAAVGWSTQDPMDLEQIDVVINALTKWRETVVTLTVEHARQDAPHDSHR